jgi:hypothetical protein
MHDNPRHEGGDKGLNGLARELVEIHSCGVGGKSSEGAEGSEK